MITPLLISLAPKYTVLEAGASTDCASGATGCCTGPTALYAPDHYTGTPLSLLDWQLAMHGRQRPKVVAWGPGLVPLNDP